MARAWSAYFDTIIGGAIGRFFSEHVKMGVGMFSDYPDFFAMGITLLLTGEHFAMGITQLLTDEHFAMGIKLLSFMQYAIQAPKPV